jgi:hypothetical protein
VRTIEDIEQNKTAFLHECHAVFKKALKLLIDDMLELEGLLEQLRKNTSREKKLTAMYKYWLRILEFTYDSFLWIASNYDRSEVSKYYKGSKHGALFDDLVFVAKQRFRLMIAAPVPVVCPFIVIESDKRSNERRQSVMLSRRRRDEVAAMANPAFISCRAMILDKSLQTGVFRTRDADREARSVGGCGGWLRPGHGTLCF